MNYEAPVPPRYGVYLRGPNEPSMDDQDYLCKQFAKDSLRISGDPIHTWRDTGSGLDITRPGLQAMQQEAESGGVDVIITTSVSKLSRDLQHLSEIVNRLHRAGVEVHFAEDRSPTHNSLLSLLADVNETVESWTGRHHRKMTTRGMEAVARQGRMPTGSAPYGYDYDPATKTRRINESEALVVRKAFQMAVEGMSPRKIADHLNREGNSGRNGRPWRSLAVTKILRDRRLTGVDLWQTIEIRGFTPEIISQEIFDRAQEALRQDQG